MAMVYECIYCKKEIESDCIFEGSVDEFMQFMKDKTKGLSDNCECRKQAVKEV